MKENSGLARKSWVFGHPCKSGDVHEYCPSEQLNSKTAKAGVLPCLEMWNSQNAGKSTPFVIPIKSETSSPISSIGL